MFVVREWHADRALDLAAELSKTPKCWRVLWPINSYYLLLNRHAFALIQSRKRSKYLRNFSAIVLSALIHIVDCVLLQHFASYHIERSLNSDQHGRVWTLKFSEHQYRWQPLVRASTLVCIYTDDSWFHQRGRFHRHMYRWILQAQ